MFQISPRPLHSDGQQLFQPPRWEQAVITLHHPAEPHRLTECSALYPAPHPALLALPLLSVVLKTCLPPSLIQKLTRLFTNPLRMRATERTQRQRQWQRQPQTVSTPQSVVSGSRCIHQFGHSDMTRLVFATRQTPGARHVEQTAIYECK